MTIANVPASPARRCGRCSWSTVGAGVFTTRGRYPHPFAVVARQSGFLSSAVGTFGPVRGTVETSGLEGSNHQYGARKPNRNRPSGPVRERHSGQ